jgi:ribosomal protein S18 acetylase RimI-like enzyme
MENNNLHLFNLWADVWGIKLNKNVSELPIETWIDSFNQSIEEAKTKKSKTILFRLTEQEKSEILGQSLIDIGFRKKHVRVEYQKDVSKLPSNDGTPLSWKTVEELNWSLQELADFVTQVAQGDPDYNPDEDPMDFIQDWINDPVLTSGLNCISIGFDNDKKCAMIVAQVNLKNGWSRIAYMGVLPEFRNKSFGKWLHRKGFEMMKEQGGTLYHGGTTSTNYAMIKLFENHGCELYCKMEEFELSLN